MQEWIQKNPMLAVGLFAVGGVAIGMFLGNK